MSCLNNLKLLSDVHLQLTFFICLLKARNLVYSLILYKHSEGDGPTDHVVLELCLLHVSCELYDQVDKEQLKVEPEECSTISNLVHHLLHII